MMIDAMFWTLMVLGVVFVVKETVNILRSPARGRHSTGGDVDVVAEPEYHLRPQPAHSCDPDEIARRVEERIQRSIQFGRLGRSLRSPTGPPPRRVNPAPDQRRSE